MRLSDHALTKGQKKVIRAMGKNWTFKRSTLKLIDTYACRLERGGQSQRVDLRTHDALIERGVIQASCDSEVTEMVLTDLGKELAEAIINA